MKRPAPRTKTCQRDSCRQLASTSDPPQIYTQIACANGNEIQSPELGNSIHILLLLLMFLHQECSFELANNNVLQRPTREQIRAVFQTLATAPQYEIRKFFKTHLMEIFTKQILLFIKNVICSYLSLTRIAEEHKYIHWHQRLTNV